MACSCSKSQITSSQESAHLRVDNYDRLNQLGILDASVEIPFRECIFNSSAVGGHICRQT